jgi:hypothetical protein
MSEKVGVTLETEVLKRSRLHRPDTDTLLTLYQPPFQLFGRSRPELLIATFFIKYEDAPKEQVWEMVIGQVTVFLKLIEARGNDSRVP